MMSLTPSLLLIRSIFAMLLLAVVFSSCKKYGDTDRATVIVDLENSKSAVEGKMMYLGNRDSGNWVDSAVVLNGKFTLSVPVDSSFLPFRVNILYASGDSLRPYNYLGFKNPFFNSTIEMAIYSDAGTVRLTQLKGFKSSNANEIVLELDHINSQTEAAFYHVSFRSGTMPDDLKYNHDLVAKYPQSVYLLNKLNAVKGQIDDKQLAQLANGFDKSLTKAPGYLSIQDFLHEDSDSGTAFPSDLALTQPDQKTISRLFTSNKKHKLVVFWASWCGPCRKEIPDLKSLHASLHDDLDIYSISVDKNEAAWKKAVEKENMPWGQFLLNDKTSFTKLNKKYQFESIPVWVLFGPDNVMMERRVGYWEGEKSVANSVSARLKK